MFAPPAVAAKELVLLFAVQHSGEIKTELRQGVGLRRPEVVGGGQEGGRDDGVDPAVGGVVRVGSSHELANLSPLDRELVAHRGPWATFATACIWLFTSI